MLLSPRKNGLLGGRFGYTYIYICRRVSFGTTFLAFQELETVPPKKKKSFLQQPEANQELETDPPES